MPQAPPGIEIITTRKTDHCRVYYGAIQTQLRRPVLLVGLAEGVLTSSPFSRQLEMEAQVLAELDHPNVLRLFDYLHDDSRIWLVLEDVDGPSLGDLLDREVSERALAAIGLDLARALSHAHGLGHIHGALTPGVVQFSRKGRTKLSGFGRKVAADSDQVELLDPESRGGLSPETSIGQAHSPLSDLFGLGALLYEVASGHPPFGDINAIDYPLKVRNSSHVPLAKLAPHLPHGLSSLIEQMLEKLPARRPASAAAVAEQLEALIGGTTLPIIGRELNDLGFENIDVPAVPAAPMKPGAPHSGSRTPALGLILGGLLLTSLVLVSALLLFRNANHQSRGEPRATAPAPPNDEESLHLRVVASRWAHVFVDGTMRETTPFAQPITLSPGSHVVRLEHPNAPPEERTISGQAGQVVLLNVQMHVKVELPSSILVGDVPESSP